MNLYQVVIGTKQGPKGIAEITISKPQLLEVEEIPEKKPEDEFENFMNKLEEMKKKRKKEVSFCYE